VAGGTEVYPQLMPGEHKDRLMHMTMMRSANESEDGVGIGSVHVDSSPEEADGGAPRHSSHFAAVPRSLSHSANT